MTLALPAIPTIAWPQTRRYQPRHAAPAPRWFERPVATWRAWRRRLVVTKLRDEATIALFRQMAESRVGQHLIAR